jgi:hypothetical protein
VRGTEVRLAYKAKKADISDYTSKPDEFRPQLPAWARLSTPTMQQTMYDSLGTARGNLDSLSDPKVFKVFPRTKNHEEHTLVMVVLGENMVPVFASATYYVNDPE